MRRKMRNDNEEKKAERCNKKEIDKRINTEKRKN